MNFRIVASTFVTVFLAELGDKTQLATFTMGAGSESRLSTFVGAASALVLSSLIAVVAADFVARRVSMRYVQAGAGVLLVVMGIVYLYGAIRARG